MLQSKKKERYYEDFAQDTSSSRLTDHLVCSFGMHTPHDYYIILTTKHVSREVVNKLMANNNKLQFSQTMKEKKPQHKYSNEEC